MAERDYDDDDDRPRRRRRRDDDDDEDDRPRRRRRDDDDDARAEDDDRPRRRRREDDDEEEFDRPRKKKKGSNLLLILGIVFGVMLLCGGGLAILLLPAVSKVREAANRANDANNLKQISLGVFNYEATVNEMSTGPYYKDPSTQQINQNLSYRVGLLPYLEYDNVYRQFKTNESWDSANNRPLSSQKIMPFQCKLDDPSVTTTRYRSFVGKGTMFEPGVTVRLSNVVDGTSNTIMFVTADEGVVWSKVDELPYSPNGPLPSFGKKAFPNGTNVAMADGSVRFLKNTTPEPVVRGLITRNGGETIPFDW